MTRTFLALLLGLLLFGALPAHAQRTFTDKALRGELVVGQPPQATLNGKPARLAPGARIRDEHNIVQTPASLSGRRLTVNYTLDLEGNLLDAWILDATERARRPWPTSLKEAQSWSFSFETQSWTKP